MIFASGSERPKAELHIHMEGSISLDTANAIAARKGLQPLPDSFYQVSDIEDFARVFKYMERFMTQEEDFFDIARDFAGRQAADGVVYTETFIQPSYHILRGMSAEAMFKGVEEGLRHGEERYGVQVHVICSVSRIFGPDAAFETLDMIERYAGERVIGIDLSGVNESPDDSALYTPVFEAARSMGLRTVAHSGEFVRPEILRQTIDQLRPERIGHGLAAWQDKELAARLVELKIPLEICPTSNVTLGAVPSLDDHPVRHLYDMGVPIVINTDDPALFNTTLSGELELLRSRFGFNPTEIEELIENGFKYAFGKYSGHHTI